MAPHTPKKHSNNAIDNDFAVPPLETGGVNQQFDEEEEEHKVSSPT